MFPSHDRPRGVVMSIKTQKIKSCWVGKNGYRYVDLYSDNKSTKIALHRLLATAFIPNPDNKRTVNHIDHNKLNNDLANLEWSTDSENIAHSYTSKTRGSSLKLSNQDLKEIAKEFFSGASLTELAKKHGVSTATLSTKLPKVVDDLGAYYIELRAQKKLRQGKCNANRNK